MQINGDSISPTAFAVKLSTGETIATLRPAVESLERRTILLIGGFSPENSLPAGVKIVGSLENAELCRSVIVTQPDR